MRDNNHHPTGRGLLEKLAGLRREERGVAAIEFAFIAPVMILIYLGCVDVGDALTVARRTDQIAYTAADLVAQVKTISTSDLDDVMDASATILSPFPTAPLSIVLTSVVADNNNKTTVGWSCARNATADSEDSSYTLPSGLTAANSSVIVAKVTYRYTPPVISSLIPGLTAFTMSRTFYARPRQSASVQKTDDSSCS